MVHVHRRRILERPEVLQRHRATRRGRGAGESIRRNQGNRGTAITLDGEITSDAFIDSAVASARHEAEGRGGRRAVRDRASHVRQGGRAVHIGDSEVEAVQVKGRTWGNGEVLTALGSNSRTTDGRRNGQGIKERILTSVQDNRARFDVSVTRDVRGAAEGQRAGARLSQHARGIEVRVDRQVRAADGMDNEFLGEDSDVARTRTIEGTTDEHTGTVDEVISPRDS